MKIIYKNIQLIAVRGDIGNQPDVDAVVNAANAELKIGGGVAAAIHRTAGPELYEECKDLAPLNPGEAVITGAYNLPNDYVIHCLGPVYGRDKPEDELLASCYKRALQLAEENMISSIAFPSISTGSFGYPFKEASQIAFEAILGEIEQLKHVEKIKFVLYGEEDLKFYLEYFEELEKAAGN